MKTLLVAHVTSQSSDKDTADSVPEVHHGRALCVYAAFLTISSLCGKKWPFSDIISITFRYVSLSNNQSIKRSVSLSAFQSVVGRSVIHSVGFSVCRSVDRSFDWSAARSVSQSLSKSVSRSINQSVRQPISQSVSQSCNADSHSVSQTFTLLRKSTRQSGIWPLDVILTI